MPISYVVLAVTGVALVALELLLRRRHHLPIDRRETVVSAVVGVVWIGTKALAGLAGVVAVYGAIHEHLAPWHLDAGNPLTWVAYYLVGDLAYYWVHRAEHRFPILWASHVVHHSARDFGFTTAVRMPPTEVVYKAVCGLWAPLLGFPPAIYAAMTASGLIAGQLQHSRMVGGMGWIDRWFATPSNHRVHHGSNPRYIDRNFGGRTMIWDRMFGTYEPETEEVRFGVTEELGSGVVATMLGGYPRLVRGWLSPDR